LANYSQNGANRKESATGIRKRHRRYEARIKKDGQEIYLGLFASSGEAMKAYGLAAAKYFGDFAK
jgi:hypothetical protein